VIARDSYQYLDANFRVSKHTTGVGAAEHATSYKYDTTGQLISADDSATTPLDESYVWDLGGNRKKKGDRVGPGNLLTIADGIRYLYDEEGNFEEERTLSGNVLLRSFGCDSSIARTSLGNHYPVPTCVRNSWAIASVTYCRSKRSRRLRCRLPGGRRPRQARH